MDDTPGGLDEIDRHILRILAQTPRIPYSDISERLKEEGFDMSGEGIRYRVSNLYDSTSVLLLTDPKEHGWEVFRMVVRVVDQEGAKERAMDAMAEENFWLVCRGVGDFDIYAVATVKSVSAGEELVDAVRSIDVVEEAEHSIETDRTARLNNYLSFE